MRWAHTIILLNVIFLQLSDNNSGLLENNNWTSIKTVAFQDSDENLFEQIMSAIKDGNLNRVEDLINKGVNVNRRNEYDQTPLLLAILEGQKEISELLISAGSDVNEEIEEGPFQFSSLVYKALELGQEDLADILIANGAAETEKKKFYYNALISALDKTDLQKAEGLITRNKIKIDKSSSMLVRYAYGSAETRQFMRTHGSTEIKDGSLNLLDYFISSGITLYNIYNDKLDFPLSTTFLHHKKQPFRYSVDKAFDGDPATTWVEGVNGPGIGEKVAFDIDKNVKAVSILPGFGVEKYFKKNNRLKNARLTVYEIEGGASVSTVGFGPSGKIFEANLVFKDEMKPQKFEINISDYEDTDVAPINFLIAVIEISAVYPGTAWDDTCISEIHLIKEQE